MEEERILPDTAHSSGKESYLSDQVPLFIVLIRLSQRLCTMTELVRSGKLWEKAPILEPLHLIMQVIYYQETERKVHEYQFYSGKEKEVPGVVSNFLSFSLMLSQLRSFTGMQNAMELCRHESFC